MSTTKYQNITISSWDMLGHGCHPLGGKVRSEIGHSENTEATETKEPTEFEPSESNEPSGDSRPVEKVKLMANMVELVDLPKLLKLVNPFKQVKPVKLGNFLIVALHQRGKQANLSAATRRSLVRRGNVKRSRQSSKNENRFENSPACIIL